MVSCRWSMLRMKNLLLAILSRMYLRVSAAVVLSLSSSSYFWLMKRRG